MPLAVYNVRIAAVFTGFLLGFGALTGWLYHLQVQRHEELYAKAREIYTSVQVRKGSRGNIFDRNGSLLAGNENCQDVMIEPRKIPPAEREKVIGFLSRFLMVPEETLRKRFGSGRIEVVGKRRVPLKRARALANQKLPGLRFVDTQRRLYPKMRLGSLITGFTDHNNRGAYGMEQVCDVHLLPKAGRLRYMRSRRGRKLHYAESSEKTPLDGNDVYLTIDEPIQHVTEKHLAKMVETFTPRYACAIMADPKSGAILAMAQYPSFNPNNRREMKPSQWRNHMVEDVYHPGSTMKPIAICGALQYKEVDLDSEFYCEKGYWMFRGRPLRDAHAFEWLTVAEIIQKSSNIGTAKISIALGERRLFQTFRRFGFGEPTGIELKHESAGLLPDLSGWDPLSVSRFPIGQGQSSTALQMVQAYCALANQGKIMQLHLLDRVVEPRTGQVLMRHRPKIKRMAASPSAVADTLKAMKMVATTEGTARRAAIPGFAVAGKTGTSQKLVNGSYEGHRKYVASFIGFAPADNPAFVLLVMADEPDPSKSYYGGTVCAPAFREIGKATLQYLNVQPQVASRER